MGGGGDLASSPPLGHDARWRSAGYLRAEVTSVLTDVAVWFGGEARKGCDLTMALWHWGRRPWGRWAHGGVAGLRPMEHEAQPHKCVQHQLVEKERRYHGKTPSYRWRNEGILPGFRRWE